MATCTAPAATITKRPDVNIAETPISLARRKSRAAVILIGLLSASCVSPPPPPPPPATPPPILTLEQAIALPHRDASRARDVYRHPRETLEFFGITDDMTVVEIWPGAGWYTEILAPFLHARGEYVAAQFPKASATPDYQKRIRAGFEQGIAANPQLFGGVRISEIGPPDRWRPVPAGSADLVLTFRNVHNWISDHTEREMFAAFNRMLKTGGVLGVEEHRAFDGATREEMVRSGYVTQDYVIQLATEAGFAFVAWEEINANPRDTKDYPAGVWTLPPTLRLGAQDRLKYLQIGESDRMTLKFVKAVEPAAIPPG